MIGFLLTTQQEQELRQGVAQAFAAEGQRLVWNYGLYKVISGKHVGKVLVHFPDAILNQSMRKGKRMSEYAGAQSLIASLGGLGARVNINVANLEPPTIG